MSQAFRDDLVVSQSDAKELKPTRDEAFYSGALTTALTDMSGISASRKDDILKSLDVQFTFAKEADEDTWKANQSEWDRNTVIG